MINILLQHTIQILLKTRIYFFYTFMLFISGLFLLLVACKNNNKATKTKKDDHTSTKQIQQQIKEYKGIHSTYLANGMRVIVKPRRNSPVLIHQVWYKVGSRHESNGITGISHMLEHLMFKGTNVLKPGEFSLRVKKLGGNDNAFTSKDYSGYFQLVAKQHLETVMYLEANRMNNIQVPIDEFESERKVVAEERRWRIDDKPFALAYETLIANAHEHTPYRHPVIGWMDDIKNYTYEDVMQWYQNYYSPNNAILVVVGDVEFNNVISLAKKYYGVIPAEHAPLEKPFMPLVKTTNKKVYVNNPKANVASILYAFKVPSLTQALQDKGISNSYSFTERDIYALDVLSYILGGNNSSLLYKDLVAKSKASQVGAFYDSIVRLDSLLIIYATEPGNPIGKAKTQKQKLKLLAQNIDKQIEKLKRELVAMSKLQAIKNRLIAENIYSKDSIYNQAQSLGMLASVGLPIELSEDWANNIEQVTSEDILRVAKKYLRKDNLTELYLTKEK